MSASVTVDDMKIKADNDVVSIEREGSQKVTIVYKEGNVFVQYGKQSPLQVNQPKS